MDLFIKLFKYILFWDSEVTLVIVKAWTWSADGESGVRASMSKIEKWCQNGTDLLPQLSSRLIFFTMVMTSLVHLVHKTERFKTSKGGVLYLESTNTSRGFSISVPPGLFLIPTALQTTSVSSLCKSSSPSPPCICFIVFCLRSRISLYLQGWGEQPQTSIFEALSSNTSTHFISLCKTVSLIWEL